MAVSSTNTASTSLSCVVTVGDWLAGFEHPLKSVHGIVFDLSPRALILNNGLGGG